MKSGVKQANTGSPVTFNGAVRKKRGTTAPPSSRCLRGKKDDKVMGSDDAINNFNHASNVQATAVKKTSAVEKNSQAIMNDVFKAEMTSTSSDDESTEEIEDVKVCDICGDVGDEEKLAVCNRCNDGAEHTYCMRVMMEKVPEGEWFCEECQAEVDFEKEESIEGKINKPANAAQSRSSSENEVGAETVGRKEWNDANQDIDMVTRRKEEDARTTQNIPELGVLSMGSDSRQRIPLSHDSSFRLGMEKGKQPTPQVPILLSSSAAKNQALPLAGQLSRSTSFNNSKVPKVKQLVNEAPQKTKTLKAQLTSSVKKEGAMSLSTKSASFKKPKTCEPAIKAKSSIVPPTEELIMMNLPVSRNASNDRGTSILGRPSITGPMAFPVQSKVESAAQCLTTGNNTAKSSNLGVANEQVAGNTLGNSKINKPLLAKAPVSITPTSSERSLGILGSGAQINFQNSGASHSDDKRNDPPSLRLGASSSNRAIHCQRCNEPGHSTQFCGADRLRLSAIEPSGERNLKDASAKRNGISEANRLVATENTSRLDQSEHILKCGPIHSSSTMPSDLMDTLSQSFKPGDKTIVSTIPELDYIWQGDFELWRTGRSPELCDGFQAHLSCSASPKVLEVAKKFPSRVQLEELPRQDSWPIQFQENGPTHDNIGVFFFARDTHSYEHHYSKLVRNMLNNDLALRGHIESAELLIFPSNILSKNSQRWNMFYFLWGVFRVKRKDHWNLPLDVPTSKCQPNLNEDCLTVDLHTTVWSSSQSSEDQKHGAEPDCNLVKSATCADNQCLQAGQKRKVDIANWTDGVDGSLDKKIKLDNVSSTVESILGENIRDGKLSSKVYPLATLSVDDCTNNKAMAGTSKSNGKCIFPLDLNVVGDPCDEL
ncbi:unnamed protein product [Alopecurus aequalis]